MNYTEAMEFLEETKKYGSILGLQSIQTLMSHLGNVQDKVAVVHIGGTNGKGSVGAMLSSVLTEAGYRVGRFNTPDVFFYEEEFLMNGTPIGKERLAEIFTKVAAACDRLVKEGHPHPTRFEVETAAAFLWFYEEKCDIALIEVGMGGETDATNIIKKPLASVLTSISMDHMKFLGNSLKEIAEVKAGIIKEKCPVVTVFQQKDVWNVIKLRCRERNTCCVCANVKENVKDISVQPDGTANFFWRFDAAQPLQNGIREKDEWNPIRTGLRGKFQIENTLCVLETLRILKKHFPNISEEHIQAGINHTIWRGRFEKIGDKPEFYLDGAHNEGAVKMLRETLDEAFHGKQITYIMGVLADKEYDKMIGIMFRQGDRVFTVTPQNPRALDGRKLAEKLWEQKVHAVYCENAKDAVLCSLQKEKSDMVLAFGSLSYLKEIKTAYEMCMNSEKMRE